MTKLRRLVQGESGYTMIELLQVTVMLGVILGGITTLMIHAMNSELEMNRRFQAQQEARVAVDRMRREIHCARLVSPNGQSASISVTLPVGCPGAPTSEVVVTYATQSAGTNRWDLRRNGVRIADYITASNVFTYTAQSISSLAKLRVELPVNLKPATEPHKTWRLVADIVLRNSTRA
jgi:type II secretory pathway pseudopilin PulG